MSDSTTTATTRSDPARRKALRALKTNPLILEAVQIEPRLKPILDEAKNQRNVPGYHRIRTYYDLKAQACLLVGSSAPKPQIRTGKHFDAIVLTIGDLLPEDDVDLYPEGKPEWRLIVHRTKQNETKRPSAKGH
jgi:hypothetical protein